ncbi:MAG: hypothetical protein ACQERC_09245 [Bacteroidota bacterium]
MIKKTKFIMFLLCALMMGAAASCGFTSPGNQPVVERAEQGYAGQTKKERRKAKRAERKAERRFWKMQSKQVKKRIRKTRRKRRREARKRNRRSWF